MILNKDEVTTKDLAALSAKVKDEFAYFESDTDNVLFHGGYPTWRITGEMYDKLIKNQYIWRAHSHPHFDDLYPSEADKQTLELLNWQESSTIIDLTGETREFTIKLTDELNERFKLNNLINDEKEQYYLDLFGGELDVDGE